MKKRVLLLASLSTLALAITVLGQEAPKVKVDASPQPAKVDSKKEAAPIKVTDQFQTSYEELNALLRVIDSLEKDAGLPALRLKANSIAAILRAQIPEGYQFEPVKKEFVPLPKPAEKVADKK